jgi:hypothetical protein
MPLTKETLRTLADDELLDLAIEEASEIIKAAIKAKRFGLPDRHPFKPNADSNVIDLALENVQIGNIIRILTARYDINYGQMCVEVERRAAEQEAHGVGFRYTAPAKPPS